MGTTLRSDAAQEYAFAELARVGDIEKLAAPLRTVVIVVSAQGIIDNGGLQYFFENDFPGRPDYSVFSEAYRRIGAVAAANALASAAGLFPFSEPELHTVRRQEFLGQFLRGGDHVPDSPFVLYTKVLWGDRIWKRLDKFIEQHAEVF